MNYENEVEYFDRMMRDTDDLKAAIFDDERFKSYILDIGVEETLYELTSFAKSISENLRNNQITTLNDAPPWARSAIGLLAKVKSRRQQMRKAVYELYGQEAIDEIQKRVLSEVEDW